VSCNRRSQHKSAPKERHNVAHGVKRWVGAPLPLPLPLSRSPCGPERSTHWTSSTGPPGGGPAGEGCRTRREGLRAQGSRPGLRYCAASRLSNRTRGSLGFMNELRLQDTRFPRSIERGPIEAGNPPTPKASEGKFPPSIERGPIESAKLAARIERYSRIHGKPAMYAPPSALRGPKNPRG
jgi:hypothetical protein